MNEVNKTVAFRLNIDQLELFFTLCKELELNDEPRRVALLHYFAQHGHVENVRTTKRSKEQLIKDLSLNFKIAHIKVKEIR